MGADVAVAELPRTRSEVESKRPSITLTPEDLPWMQDKSQTIELTKIRGSNGIEYYLGLAIAHDKIQRAEDKLKKNKRDERFADELIEKYTPMWIENPQLHQARPVKNAISKKKVFYFGHVKNVRAYFMRLDNVNGATLIIRIGSCYKVNEPDILSTITSSKGV